MSSQFARYTIEAIMPATIAWAQPSVEVLQRPTLFAKKPATTPKRLLNLPLVAFTIRPADRAQAKAAGFTLCDAERAFNLGPEFAPKSAEGWERLLTSVDGCCRAVLVILSVNGEAAFELLLFRDPAVIPRQARGKATDASLPTYRGMYRRLQPDAPINVIGVDLELPTSSARFGHTFRMSYANVHQLAAGATLNPLRPLELAFDPDYAGLPADSDGFNCATNYEGVSIPRFRPVDWNLPVLDRVRSLRAISAADWETIISFSLGKLVDGIDNLVDESDEDEREDREIPTRRRSSAAPKVARAGTCYDGDYAAFTIAGPFVIFRVVRPSGTWYVVDSPLYGVALRIFDRLDYALAWTRGGKSRALMKLVEGFCRYKDYHDADGDWRTEATRFLNTQTPNPPTPALALETDPTAAKDVPPAFCG